jgi:hypothetical protein
MQKKKNGICGLGARIIFQEPNPRNFPMQTVVKSNRVRYIFFKNEINLDK